MRLGEIKQKLSLVINESNHIFLEQEALYSNQLYKIGNYSFVVDALKSIKDFGWVEQNFELIQEIIEVKSSVKVSVELTQEEFNKMNSYINAINQKLPIFYSMLDSVVDDQEEMVINIKLPQNIENIADLSKLNNRLEHVLKFYNIDGQFDFQGFDKGTNWYVILATGQLSYWMLIGGLNIANKFFETKKTYYEGRAAKFKYKKAELEYRAATQNEKATKKDLEGYVERRLKLQVEQDVNKLSERVDNTNNKPENLIKILKATKALLTELEKGDFEFHLSLNPPKQISENNGTLKIDYSNMPVINDKKEIKEISSNPDNVEK